MAATNNATQKRIKEQPRQGDVRQTEWDVRPSRAKAAETWKRRAVEIVEKLHPEQMKKRRKALAYCAAALIVFAMCSMVISGYAAISAVNLENLKLEAQAQEIREQIEKKSVEMASNTDLVSIQSVAKEKLGMDFPKNSQVRYIQVADPPAQETDKGPVDEPGFFQVIWKGIVDLLS